MARNKKKAPKSVTFRPAAENREWLFSIAAELTKGNISSYLNGLISLHRLIVDEDAAPGGEWPKNWRAEDLRDALSALRARTLARKALESQKKIVDTPKQ